MQPLYRSRQPLFCDAKGRRKTGPAGPHPEPAPAEAGVGRALAQLGIEHIPAFSPEARGRSERALRTLQDRLPKELAVAGITTTAAADRYLREVFVPAYNARFSVVPEQPGSAFVAIGDLDLDQVLCLEEPRQVGNDNTVTWRRRRLQIPASPLRPHFVRAQVKVAPAPRRLPEHFSRPALHRAIPARWTDP